MSSSTNFGASVVPSTHLTAGNDRLHPTTTLDSPVLTPAASHEDLQTPYSQKSVPIHSPFYQHPPASFERAATHNHTASQDAIRAPGMDDKDLETGLSGDTTRLTSLHDEKNPFTSKISVDCNKECRMWPSKQTLMQTKAAEQKRKRERKLCGGCGPIVELWQRRSKKQKLAISIAIALFLIGVVVAIAVGISIAVDGTVYKNNNTSTQIAGT